MRKIISVFLIFLMLNTQIGVVLAQPPIPPWYMPPSPPDVVKVGPFTIPLTGNPWIDGYLKSAIKIGYNLMKGLANFFSHPPHMLTAWQSLPWWVKPFSGYLPDFVGVNLGFALAHNALGLYFWAVQQKFSRVPKWFRSGIKLISSSGFHGLLQYVKVSAENLKKFIIYYLLLLYMGVDRAENLKYAKIVRTFADMLGGIKEALTKVIVASPAWIEYVIKSIPNPKITIPKVGDLFAKAIYPVLMGIDTFAKCFIPGWASGFNIGQGFVLYSAVKDIYGYFISVVKHYINYWTTNISVNALQKQVSSLIDLPKKLFYHIASSIRGLLPKLSSPPQVLNWPEFMGVLSLIGHVEKYISQAMKWLHKLPILCTYSLSASLPPPGTPEWYEYWAHQHVQQVLTTIQKKIILAQKLTDIILNTISYMSKYSWSLHNLAKAVLSAVIGAFNVGVKWLDRIVNLIEEIPKMTSEARQLLWTVLSDIRYGINGVVWALRNYIYELLFKPLIDWVHNVLNGLLNGIKMVFENGVEWMDKYILYPVQKFGVYLNNEIRSWFGMDVGYVMVGR